MVDKSLKGVMANELFKFFFWWREFRLSLLLISCLKTRGFSLTKWVSNSKVILENIPSSDLSPNFINLDLNSQPVERVLGMIWNVSEEFFLSLNLCWNNVFLPKEYSGYRCINPCPFRYFGSINPWGKVDNSINVGWKYKLGWPDRRLFRKEVE